MRYLFVLAILVLLASCQSPQTEEWTVITVVESSETDQPELSEEVKIFLAEMEERERRTIDARLGSTTSRCSIHDALLSEDVVPLVFGFPVGQNEYDKARLKLFWHSNRYHQTCVVSDARFASPVDWRSVS